MDTVEPRKPKRAPAQTVARTKTPADPRQEAPTGGTPRPKNGTSTGTRKNGVKSGAAKSGSAKNGAPASTKPRNGAAGTDTTNPSGVALVEPVEHGDDHGNGLVWSDDVEARGVEVMPEGPIEIPEIIPAEPIEEEATTTEVPAEVEVTEPAEAPETSETDGTGGLPSMKRQRRQPRPLRAPVVVPRRRRPRVRRVTRVVRHVDTWSVFKIALIFNVFLYAVCLVAGVLLWQVASNTGTVDNIERWFESFGWQTFELKGGEIYHNGWIAGLFVIVGLTGLAVLAATMFNLITDLVGGIRVSVLEEEVVAREDRGLGWRPSRRQRRTVFDTATNQVYTEPVFVPVTADDAAEMSVDGDDTGEFATAEPIVDGDVVEPSADRDAEASAVEASGVEASDDAAHEAG